MTSTQLTHRLLAWLFSLSCLMPVMAQTTASEQLVSIPRGAGNDPVLFAILADHPQRVSVVFLAMPGGEGQLHLEESKGHVKFDLTDNFLVRSRRLFLDDITAYVLTPASGSPEHVQAVLLELKKRFPQAGVYLITTSRSTLDSMKLAPVLDGELAGIIHTSAFDSISTLDTRGLKTPHVLVHHSHDDCPFTPLASVKRNHDVFGTALIEVSGGSTSGDPCQSMSYHGFKGAETQTVSQIKAWIKSLAH